MDSRRANRVGRAKLATVLALVVLPASAVAADRTVGGGSEPPRARDRGPADFDVRQRARRATPAARTRGAQRRLRRALGAQGVLELDRDTGTPSIVARRNGFLTGRRRGRAGRIALDYLRANAGAFGLDRDDIASLREVRRATTRRGLTRIEWQQVDDGVPAFDNVIRANVSRGRLVNISGAPKADLSAPSTRRRLDAPTAVERALRSVGVSRQVRPLRTARDGHVLMSGGHRARLVLFVEPDRTRLAWSTVARANGDGVYRTVVDATTGELLRRTNLVASATVHAFDYTPIAASGGAVQARTASTTGSDPWLTGGFDRLRGDNALSYSDENDDTYEPTSNPTGPTAAQEVPPSSGSGSAANATWNYPQVTGTFAGSNCPASGCTWDAASPIAPPFAEGDNWHKNREQVGAQVFYFVNNFHDHLQNDPNIDFSDTWGNFEQSSTGGIGGDPVHAQVDDGAATALLSDDFPNAAHLNNASMITLDEVPGDPFNSPQMAMFLFGDLDADAVSTDPNDVNGGDDAAIVYHEYVHGLSNRLVDPDGSGDLFTPQGGAMGEAWSDWYAIDYLNENGFEPDDPSFVDIFYGEYGNVPFSRQGLDCTVGDTAQCTAPAGGTAGAGGFTYGDFGKIRNGAEVHADGEIWAQTLWDLRRSLIGAHGTAAGIGRARALVTDAMRLSPTDPDFLDMRDAILQADQVNAFGDCQLIWTVFAARGMGANASTSGPADTAPIEGFTPGACTGGGGGGGTGGGGSTAPPATVGGGGTGTFDLSLLLPAKANLSGVPASIRVDRRGRFRLRFRGTASLEGTAVLRSVNRVRTSARSRIRVARKAFTVSDSGRVTLRLKLSRRNLRILRLNRRYRVRVTVELRNVFGKSTATRRFTLRAPRLRS